MVKVDDITKDWREAGSFAAQMNLYGFWDEHAFLTKSGDLGCVMKIGGIDYESFDHAGRDYAVKRLEAALRSLDDRCRLYQILFKRNRPAIPRAEYDSPLVRAAQEERGAFLASKADRLYSIDIYWAVMIDGNYARTGLLRALSQLPKQPRASLSDLRALFSGHKERTLIYEQIERDRLRLQQKVQSVSGQLSDLTTVELPGAEETLRILRRLVNFRPSKFQEARLYGADHLDWQVCDSELEAHRGYLRMDADYLRVLTLKEMPSETRPLILNGLLDIPANFHVVTEWHPVTNDRARKEISHFTDDCGLDESILPRSHGVAFVEEFPILIRDAVCFTFFDEGALSASSFERFLGRHRAVFAALPAFELIYLSDASENFARARRIFAAQFAIEGAPGSTPLTPRGVDHLLDYLTARERADVNDSPLTLRDLAVLREGESIYTTNEHQAIVSAWQGGDSNADRIRQRFGRQAQRGKFTASVLPYSYPLHHFKFENDSKPELGSSERSTRRLSSEEQLMQKQIFSEGGES